MPLCFNVTEIEILIYLFKKAREKQSYLYKIQKELDKSPSTILDNLGKMEKKGLVKPLEVPVPRGKRGPTRYYNLTPFGKALAKTIIMKDTFQAR